MTFYEDNDIKIYNSNCRNMAELADESVQCCVTSPPYHGLRKYKGGQDSIWNDWRGDCLHEWGKDIIHSKGYAGDKSTLAGTQTGDIGKETTNQGSYCILCGAWRGAYGLEPDAEMYVNHTIEIFREVRRVLRSDGVCFLNIGDSYLNKQLSLIPFRVAIAAQQDGWYVRSVIIWSKNNPMPESVKDRPTESHEYILLLTKSSRYYWDMEAVREVATGYDGRHDTIMKPSGKYADRNHMIDGVNAESVHTRGAERWPNSVKYDGTDYGGNGTSFKGRSCNKLADGTFMVPGRNLRSVWEFPTQPYKAAHFATFPEELPERCIKAGSKEGDLILDPFTGSGTTLWVAKKLGRRGVGYELSTEYCELAVNRNRQQALSVMDLSK